MPGPGILDLGVIERHRAAIRLGAFTPECLVRPATRWPEAMVGSPHVVRCRGELGRLEVGRPRLQVVQEATHEETIEENGVTIRLAAEGEFPGGLLEALREDLEVVREDPGEDLVARREAQELMVACLVALDVKIGSWMCWRPSVRSRDNKSITFGTVVMVIAKHVSRLAGISPRSLLRVDRF